MRAHHGSVGTSGCGGNGSSGLGDEHGGGVGVCASLVAAGTLNGHDATILLPAIYLMGNPVQNTGRCLGTAGVNPKYYPHIIAVCVINALLSMWVMQLLF